MSAAGRNLPGRSRQQLDQYMTPAWAVEALLAEAADSIPGPVLDPCCGSGSILSALGGHPVERIGMDLDEGMVDLARQALRVADRPAEGLTDSAVSGDFLGPLGHVQGFVGGWGVETIVTNPPYRLAEEFIVRSLAVLPSGGRVFALLRLGFLASQRRRHLYEGDRFRGVYVLTRRPSFVHGRTDASEYGWFWWSVAPAGGRRPRAPVVKRLEVQP